MKGRPAKTSASANYLRNLAMRRLALLVGIAFASPIPYAGAAPIWANAGAGSWFTAANWNPAAVPVAGDQVIVSNGGTAQLAGGGATPVLGSLSIGIGSSGTGTGTVASNAVSIRSSGALNVGTVGTAGTFADGVLSVSGADAQAGSVLVGTVVGATAAASASGIVSVDGSLGLTGGALQAGRIEESGRGSTATGKVTIGGNAGLTSALIAGDVIASDATRVGNTAVAEIDIGGDLALSPFAGLRIGTTFGTDRAVESQVFVNEARGRVAIGGTLSVLGDLPFVNIGTTANGIVDGSLSVGAIDMAAGARMQSLTIGFSQGGTASGKLSIGSGDLRVGTLRVGVTSMGSALGELTTGGTIEGAGTGNLLVGFASGAAGNVVNAEGTIEAAGLTDFTSYQIGSLTGTVGAGSQARGRVAASSVATSSTTSAINVGSLTETFARSSASGELILSGSTLALIGGGLQAGRIEESGRGSTATGKVVIGGNAGLTSALIAGDVIASDATRVGNTAVAEIDIGGDLALSPFAGLRIGTTFGTDRAVESQVFVNEARGRVAIGGTLSVLGDLPFVNIGTTANGIVDGSLSVGAIDMAAGARMQSLTIGFSQGGTASGKLSIGSGDLRVGTLRVGVTSMGSALGTLALQGTTLEADTVLAGSGAGGSARIALLDSTASIANDFTLTNGELVLDDSLLTVGDTFTLGANATLALDIDGFARGSEYGAIDTRIALLDGVLAIDLSDLDFVGDVLVFDLLRSGDVDGIQGDFDSFLFTGLRSGYSALAGVELDNFEVYRLRITRQAVPEPGTWALLLGAGLAMSFARRRK